MELSDLVIVTGAIGTISLTATSSIMGYKDYKEAQERYIELQGHSSLAEPKYSTFVFYNLKETLMFFVGKEKREKIIGINPLDNYNFAGEE